MKTRKKLVTIDGAVKKDQQYTSERKNQNLNNVLRYSGGLKETADSDNIFLERILDGSLKSLPIRSASQFVDISSIDGDLIYVREYPFRKATISGAVYKPGTYMMAAGETVEDLINKAGGYTDIAYPFGAIYENSDAKVVNKKAKEVLYNEFLDNIIAMSQRV